jgi:hypothetical protein
LRRTPFYFIHMTVGLYKVHTDSSGGGRWLVLFGFVEFDRFLFDHLDPSSRLMVQIWVRSIVTTITASVLPFLRLPSISVKWLFPSIFASEVIISILIIILRPNSAELRWKSSVLSWVIVGFCPHFRWSQPCVSLGLAVWGVVAGSLVSPVCRLVNMAVVVALLCLLVQSDQLHLLHFIVVRAHFFGVSI